MWLYKTAVLKYSGEKSKMTAISWVGIKQDYTKTNVCKKELDEIVKHWKKTDTSEIPIWGGKY